MRFSTILEQRRTARWHRELTVYLSREDDRFYGLGVMRNTDSEKPAYQFNPKSPLIAIPDGRGGFVDPEGVPIAIF